jgi:hypothetical protein
MIKAFLTLLLALNLSGCSEKTPDIVQPTPVVKTLNLEFCNTVIEKTSDGYTFTGITYEQFEKCRTIQQSNDLEKSKQALANKDLSKYGVKKVYTVDEGRDVRALKEILEKVYRYQIYTSDDIKYDRGDFHEDISYYIDAVEKLDIKGLRNDYQKGKEFLKTTGYPARHFTFKKGKWWATGDCESTFRAIETYAVKAGINPQRLFEVYGEVMTDSSMLTPAGGHMWGYYIGASGKTYTLEQIPEFRTMGSLIRDEYYKPIEQRRCDQPVNAFQPFHPKMIEDFKNDIPIRLRTTNER